MVGVLAVNFGFSAPSFLFLAFFFAALVGFDFELWVLVTALPLGCGLIV